MDLRRDRQSDERRYNLPTSNEVAMVFENFDGEPPFNRDIRIYPRSDQENLPTRLNLLSCNLDPMVYPLLYPCGYPGWRPNWQLESYVTVPVEPSNRRTKVSILQWKSAQLAVRRNKFNPILYAGKLFQQWLVDSYLQVEANNLNFIRTQQNRLRADLYSGLVDHLANEANIAGRAAGRAVILPSSFQGSPRNMKERYHDAMAIVGECGSPDVFATITCNPHWREITENLFPGQTPSDRPDLVARVFKLKLDEMMRYIKLSGIFGRVIGFCYTIEFQKRGLPHAHILFILHRDDKFSTPDAINKIVSAEIPDPIQSPHLFEIVTRCMIHGPCGSQNRNSPCMVDGACSKKFPKQYQEETYANVNGYPLYKRANTSSIVIRGKEVDNRFVVPYNAKLLLMFNAHINIEICSSVTAVKYLYKYIYKGYDSAHLVLTMDGLMDVNEIKSFVDTRYVSAVESSWRLNECKMHDKSHVVIRLQIHLPGAQIIHFNEGQEAEAVERADGRLTNLTAWFSLNATDPQARSILYPNIPKYYVFKKVAGENKWERRRNSRGKTYILKNK